MRPSPRSGTIARAPVVLVATLIAALSSADLRHVDALVDQGRLAEAREILTASLADPALRGECLVSLTRLANREGDWKSGTDWGEKAVEAGPTSSSAHYEYAVALRIKMSSVGKLKAMMTLGKYKDEVAEAIRLDPKAVEPRIEEIGFLLNAPSIAGGDKEQARRRIAELKAIDWLQGSRLEALALQADGDTEGALQVLTAVLERAPQDHTSRFSRALLLQQLGRYATAESDLLALAEVSEGEWALAALYQRARSRILGKYEGDQAVELLQAYIDEVPADTATLPGRSPAYWRLGNAYELVGRPEDARAAYQKALALDPDNDEAKKALSKLKKQ